MVAPAIIPPAGGEDFFTFALAAVLVPDAAEFKVVVVLLT
jgi:hypothetical protein